MPEYLEFRCCMCPNRNDKPDSMQCPPNPPDRPSPTPCRFVKRYIDSRGWKYKARAGLGENAFSVFYQKPEKQGELGWKSVKTVKWFEYFDGAQSALNELAKRKGWDEHEGINAI